MENILLIHQISDEIRKVEDENNYLKRLLELNTIRNIEAHICLSNNILEKDYKTFIGEDRMRKIQSLINLQVYKKDNSFGIGFEWQGDISYQKNNSIKIIDNIEEMKNILDQIVVQ